MNHSVNRKTIVAVFVLSALLSLTNSSALAQRYSAWSAPENLGANINTTALEGCPFIAPDNLSLFFASDRAGGAGGTDIYVSNRASANAPWGTPLNLGANINTSGVEFCPTLIAGGLTLYFVSDKPGGCGGNDIYVSQRLNNQGQWGPALNLGCQFNSPQSDITPSLFTDNNGSTFLYFSSDRPGGLGLQDVYVSTLQGNGSFGTPILVDGLNTASNDLRPNIRVRDGLEIFFESNRTGTLGGTDLYVSTRATTSSGWSTPENLGAVVNTASGESRPSLSFDGRELYFQSNRPGGFGNVDVFVTRRTAFTPFDFDGDGKADVSVYRPSTGVWYILRSLGGSAVSSWGISTDKITPADYDGDGKTDLAVYRPSTGVWYVVNSGNGTNTIFGFGNSTDIPTPGDFDGDGRADVAIYRPSDGSWWINRSTAGFTVVKWGINGDIPTVGDYDGDGKADNAVYRPSTGVWYILRSTGGVTVAALGVSTDKVVPADYDGDGKTDIAVYRPSTGAWYIVNSANGTYFVSNFGNSTDIPTPADFDGDGRADIAIYRPSDGNWWINRSTSGLIIQRWGISEDQPAPNAY